MNSPGTFYPMLQVIAALVTFVAVYLSLVVCAIICLVAAELISEHVSMVREYGVNPVPVETRVLSEMESEARKSSRQHLVCRPSDGSRDTERILPLASVQSQRH